MKQNNPSTPIHNHQNIITSCEPVRDTIKFFLPRWRKMKIQDTKISKLIIRNLFPWLTLTTGSKIFRSPNTKRRRPLIWKKVFGTKFASKFIKQRIIGEKSKRENNTQLITSPSQLVKKYTMQKSAVQDQILKTRRFTRMTHYNSQCYSGRGNQWNNLKHNFARSSGDHSLS